MSFSILLIGLISILSLQTAQADEYPLADRLNFSGDFRYRNEKIDAESSRLIRQRHRIRLRLAAQFRVNETIDVNTRLATGMGEPQSTNQDLSGGFGGKSFWIDRAFFDYHPYSRVKFLGGKFGLPIETTDLAWDGDLNGEGMALQIKTTRKGKINFFGSSGGFWLSENSNSAEQGLFLMQAGVHATGDFISWLTAVGYNDFGNVKNHSTIYDLHKGYGNSVRADTLTGNTIYEEDFNIIQFYGAAVFQLDNFVLTVNGDIVNNTAADEDNLGWLAGLSLKGASKKLPWQTGYNYRVLEKDATIGIFTDSDFAGGGTNSNGYKLWFVISPLHSTTLKFTYFNNTLEPEAAKQNYQRFMIDLDLEF